MPSIAQRLAKLEESARQRGSKFKRSKFAMRFIEHAPADDITPELAEVEAAARAAGWQPGDGLYCIIVEMAGSEERPQIRWTEETKDGRQEFIKVRGQALTLGRLYENISWGSGGL
jgi:hypothetical protein